MQPDATPHRAEDGVLAPRRRGLTLGVLLAVAVFAAEGMGVVPAIPTAVRALGGLGLFGWAFSAFMLAWLVGTVAAGQLADARGPLRPMALGLCGFAAGLLLAATATGMGRFLAGRALQGAGGGAMIAAGYVAIARGYPDALRARMMALTASVWILPSVVGPALSGAIVQRAGWRMVFAGIVPLVALVALLVLRPLRALSVHHPRTVPSRIPAAVRLSVGAGLVLAAPLLPQEVFPGVRHWAWPLVVGAALVGVALGVPALRKLLPPGTLRGRRGLPAGIALRGLLAMSFFGAESFVPLAASELRGATPTQAGLALTAGSLGWIAMSWVQDGMEARNGAVGRVVRVRVGFAVVVVGIATVAATLVTALPTILIAVGWAVGGAGIGLAYTSGGLVCIAAAPAGAEGEVTGQLQLSEALGTSAGAGLGGALLTMVRQLGHSPREAHAAVFSLTLAVALVATAIAGRIATRPGIPPLPTDAVR